MNETVVISNMLMRLIFQFDINVISNKVCIKGGITFVNSHIKLQPNNTYQLLQPKSLKFSKIKISHKIQDLRTLLKKMFIINVSFPSLLKILYFQGKTRRK